MLDEDGALACREVADRVRAVQVALHAKAARRESLSGDPRGGEWPVEFRPAVIGRWHRDQPD
jgi:hypothetical protein